MTVQLMLPLADVLGWVQGLLPLVVFLLVLFYMVGEKQLKNQRMAQRKLPPQNKPPADRPRSAAPTRAPRPVRNEEIEEFLRRAAQKRSDSPGGATRPASPAPSAASPRTAGGMRHAGGARPAGASRPAKTSAEAKSGGARQSPPSLSQGVSDRLSTKQFEARASELAGDVIRINLEHEQRLKKTFDHRLGALGGDTKAAGQPAAASKPAEGVGMGLVDLLRGNSIQQAFVLGEILRRPEDRW